MIPIQMGSCCQRRVSSFITLRFNFSTSANCLTFLFGVERTLRIFGMIHNERSRNICILDIDWYMGLKNVFFFGELVNLINSIIVRGIQQEKGNNLIII